MWKQATPRFWRAVGWLGGLRGFSWLALRAYLRTLEATHSMLVNIYLGLTEELSLRQFFVPLTLRSTDRKALEAPPRTTQQILTDAEQKRLLLLGAPGSGKSTLLKALAVGVSRHEWVDFNDLAPVLASLRAYGPVADQKPLLAWLAEDHLPHYGLRKAAALLENLLAQGRVLLLLDGLDEVAGDKLDWVNRRISDFLRDNDKSERRCRVLLTCREQNYDALADREHYPREGFTVYRVAELRDSEIEDIVQRRADSFTERGKSKEHYLKQVYLHPGIAQLHRNPLLLTLSMGVYLHGPDTEVPQNLAQFYEQSIDNLLRRWNFRESDGQSRNRFNAEDKFRFLRYFARDSLKKASAANLDFEEFEYVALTDAVRDLAEHGKLSIAADDADAFVREIHKQAGLLSALRDERDDRKDGLYVFAHRSLHEYCAAAGFSRQGDEGLQEVIAQLGNPAWRQVIFFYCAMEHDNALRLVEIIYRQAVDSGNLDLLALAGHGAAVMAEPHPQLRLEILDRLSDALAQADAAKRPDLLKSLLALGNSRGTEIKVRLDVALRRFIDVSDANQIVQEVGRMEPAVALEFLIFFAASDELNRKILVLYSLEHLDGINKIPLLWRLLLDLRTMQRTGRKAIAQLLNMMAESGAVDRLNNCKPSSSQNDEPSRKQIEHVYPFLRPGQSVTNFIRLLVWAVEARIWNDPVFGRVKPLAKDQLECRNFLNIVLSRKNSDERKDWRNLPQDRKRWIPQIEAFRLGRILWGAPVSLGAVFTLIWIFSGFYGDPLNSTFVVIKANLFVGLALVPFWLLWRWLLEKFNMLGQMETYPKVLRRWLANSAPISAHGWVKRIIYWGMRTVQISCGLNAAYLLAHLEDKLNSSHKTGDQLALWLVLVFITFFLPALNWFDRGKVIYLRKPNRYLHLYQIPHVERWLPPEEK